MANHSSTGLWRPSTPSTAAPGAKWRLSKRERPFSTTELPGLETEHLVPTIKGPRFGVGLRPYLHLRHLRGVTVPEY